jgi:hypothetical protein
MACIRPVVRHHRIKTRVWEDLRALMRRFLGEARQPLMDILINENDYETPAIKKV